MPTTKTALRFFLTLCVLLLSLGTLPCQEKLDHKILVEKVKNGSERIYKEYINHYDSYLSKFPEDVEVMVEKCLFIQNAQYDDYEDYNPHQAEFDSCTSVLISKFPTYPKVLILQTTYKWGEELEEVFSNAENSILRNPDECDSASLAELYKSMAYSYFYDEDYKKRISTYEKQYHTKKSANFLSFTPKF